MEEVSFLFLLYLHKKNNEMYIKGHCTTNLDNYRMSVTKFYRVPNKGEQISCFRGGRDATLKVCQITHSMKDGEPYIIVELHNSF